MGRTQSYRIGDRTIDHLKALGERRCASMTVIELSRRIGRSIHAIYAALRLLHWHYKREKGSLKQLLEQTQQREEAHE